MLEIDRSYERTYSPRMMAAGIILMCIRVRCYVEYRTDDGFFMPEVSHISYFLSFLCCAALVSSFRQSVLNAVPFTLIPSYSVTLPFWDLAWIMRYNEISTWEFINALTIHIPCFIMAIWVLINRKDLISWQSILTAVGFGLPYFFIIDNKTNELQINGWIYTVVVVSVAFFWLWIIKKKLLVETNMKDPFTTNFVGLKYIPRTIKEEPAKAVN